MTERLKIHYNLNDAIAGEKIKCMAEKVTEVTLGGSSGRHRKQVVTIQNGTCWITKSFRHGPIAI